MKHISLKPLLFLAAFAAALGVAAVSVRAADSGETDLAAIKKTLATVLANQQTMLEELKFLKEELYIVKIRCSS